MSNIGFATLSVIPSLRGADAAIKKQLGGLGGASDAAGAQIGAGLSGGAKPGLASLKTGLLATGAVALGAGVALFKIGEQFDEASDTIRVGTGATGKALAGLEADFKGVLGTVPTDFASAGTAIADLNTRLGLTGKPLQAMSSQFLELSRITKTDVSANIADITRVFGDWGTSMEDQPATLDKIFRASQATGIGINRLSQSVVQFGAPMRELGFSFDDSIALLSKFEKEGVNAELVMGGLKQGLGRLAKAGKDPRKELFGLMASIEAAGLTAENKGKVFELFGARAGIDMAKAIEEGRFEVGDLLKTISSGEDTILKAGKDTQDFAEQWTLFKNRVLIGLEPIAKRVFGALGKAMEFINTPAGKVVASVLGIAVGAALLGKSVKLLGGGFKLLKGNILGLFSALRTGFLFLAANPIFLIIAAVVALGFVIFKFRKQIFGALKAIGRFFARIGGAIAGFFTGLPRKILPIVKKFFPLIIGVLFPPLGIIAALIKFREPIFRFFRELPGKILGFLSGAAGWLLGVGRDILVGLWNGARAILGAYLGFWKAIPGLVLRALGALGSFLLNAGKALLTGLWNGIKLVARLVVAYFKALPRLYLRALGAIGSFLLGAGKALLQGLWNGIKTVAGLVIGYFKALPGRFLSGLGAIGRFLLGAGKALLTGLWNGIKAIVPAVLGFLKALPGRLLGALGNLGKLFFNLGKEAIKGLINGFKSLAGAAVGAVKDIALSVVKAPLKIFGIGSPSKVFADYGRHIVEGFALGIRHNQGLAMRAFDALSDDMLNRSGDIFAGADRFAIASTINGTSGGAAAAVSQAGDVITIEINNPAPEPASTSIPAALRRAQLIRGK